MSDYKYPDTSTTEGKFKAELGSVRTSLGWLAQAIKGDPELILLRDPLEIRDHLLRIIAESVKRESVFWDSKTQKPKSSPAD